MDFLKLIIFIVVLVILIAVFEKLMRKWLRIEKVSDSERYVNNVHLVGEVLLTLSFTISIALLSDDDSLVGALLIIYSFVYFSFITFMEWKFRVNSKEYIITLLSGIFSTMLVVISVNIPKLILH